MTTELPIIKYDPSNYGITIKGAKVHKKALVIGPQHIHVLDKIIIQAKVVIRADLAPVKIGSYSFIDEGTILHPSHKTAVIKIEQENKERSVFNYIGLNIGDYVYIEKNCIISNSIGNHVYVGQNSIICRGAIVKECCHIMENTVVPPETVIPPYSIVSGNPAKIVGQLPLNMSQMMMDILIERYHKFVPYSRSDELSSLNDSKT